MTLKELKDYIESFENERVFDFGLSEPFSWRGSYDEVAFAVLEEKMTKEELLMYIDLAYTTIHYGYKGGEYRYADFTPVNFEADYGMYTGGGYCKRWIEKIKDEKIPFDRETELVELIFPK